MSFIFYDGDNIGRRFKRAYCSSDLAKLRLLSATIRDIHGEIQEACNIAEARLVECGGDEGLIEVQGIALPLATEIEGVWRSYGLSATVSSGDSPAEAYRACQRKKARQNELD